jgi:hypothetical protein
MMRNRKSILAGKKAHKVKNDVASGEDEYILFLSKTCPGSVPDKTIIKQEGWQFPEGITIHQDSKFPGHTPEGVVIRMPVKNPKNRELSVEQKKDNKVKVSKRVKVEQAIGKVETCRILKDCIRMWKQGIKDLVIVPCFAHHYFKIAHKT